MASKREPHILCIWCGHILNIGTHGIAYDVCDACLICVMHALDQREATTAPAPAAQVSRRRWGLRREA
jgi:hypothetical protein